MGLFDRAISFALPAVPRPVVRYFSRPYIAGTTVGEAFDAARRMAELGAMSTLDILGEFISTPDEAAVNTRAYVDLAGRIHEARLPETNISVKLTALGLLIDRDLCLENMRRLVERIEATDSFVRIDMEDSGCTDATLEVYRTLRNEYPRRVGIVLQSRLRRSLEDIDRLTEEPANFRICKGIYLEPEEIAYTGFEEIREHFVRMLERMFERGAYVGIATHDEGLAEASLRLIRERRLGPEQYEFQMLLGVAEGLRARLIEAGHRLRVYVPYGAQWYAYSVRRLRENPQIAGHAFKALFKRR